MDNRPNHDVELPVRFPGALSLKDLITLVSVAVSLTIAWGVFGTRLTLIEKEQETHAAADEKTSADVEELKKRTIEVEQRQYENSLLIDRLYEVNNIPTPKRRPSY